MIKFFRNIIDRLILISPPSYFIIIGYIMEILMILRAYTDEAVNGMVENKCQFHDFNFTSDLWEAPRKTKQKKK